MNRPFIQSSVIPNLESEMSQAASGSQRVLRPRKSRSDYIDTRRVLRSGVARLSEPSPSTEKADQTKRRKVDVSRSRSRSRSVVPSIELGSKLPLELWSIIFGYLDKSSDLARVSRLCRFLHFEAESELYHFVGLERVPHIRNFYRTIASSPQRAARVRTLWILDNGHFRNAAATIGEILKLVGNVTDLQLLVNITNQTLLETLLAEMKQCTFQLRRFGTTLDLAPGLFDFLAQQPNIERLCARPNPWNPPEATLSADALPNLRILSVSISFMPVLQHAHSITHLDVFLADQQIIDKVLRLLGHQLISLKIVRLVATDRFPTAIVRNVPAPTLRFLEVRDITIRNLVPRNTEVDVADMAGSEVVIERFLWAPDWMNSSLSDSFLDTYGASLEDVRCFAKANLETWKSLRQFVYMASEDSYTSCMLSKEGELVEEDMATIKQWHEV